MVAALVLGGACSSGDDRAAIVLDGSARYPDDQGVATTLTLDKITLDEKRTYKVSKQLKAFSTLTATLEPMLGRRGQYVQIGVDGDTMIWMAGVAEVVRLQQGPRVFYNGTLRKVDDDGRFVFRDGTVWEVADDLPQPKPGDRVQLEIDVLEHRAVKVHP